MNFIIHFSFSDFVEDIPAGSVVYKSSYTEARQNIIDNVVLLGSEASNPGGTIHTVRLVIDAEGGGDEPSFNASTKIEELLLLKGMVSRRGVLLTEGLIEALGLYGRPGFTYKISELNEIVAKEKERVELNGRG